eukprot:7577283-Heterocapsa_arctica.AAC.1
MGLRGGSKPARACSRLARLAGRREQLGSAVLPFALLGGAQLVRSTLSQSGPGTSGLGLGTRCVRV